MKNTGRQPTWFRRCEIYRTLLAWRPFNCTLVADELGVNPKTIWRDIMALRRSGIAIEFDPAANTFRLSTPDYEI